MINTDLIKIYFVRELSFKKQKQAIDRKINILTAARLSVVLIAALVIYFQWGNWQLLGAVAGISILIFLILVRIFVDLKDKSEHLGELSDLNQREVQLVLGKYGQFNDGAELVETRHPFAFDLDIFGAGSLFQYINRSSTAIGKLKLAKWFKEPLQEADAIYARQAAIKELHDDIQWRQDFQASGYRNMESAEEKDSILDWLKEPDFFIHIKWLKPLRFGLPLITTTLVALWGFGVLTYHIPLVFFLMQLGVVAKFNKNIMAQHNQLSQKFKLLKKYAALLGWVEEKEFSAQLLKDIKQHTKTKDQAASESFGKLAKIVDRLDSRNNALGALFTNGLYLRDILNIISLEQWKNDFKEAVPQWFEAISDIDALISLTTFHQNHPEFPFPEVVDDRFTFQAKGLAHPLLKSKGRVSNDVVLERQGQFSLITGANMAGKSTFLRSIGVNMILGMIGAPVCAESMTLGTTHIYTSMRATDSLQKNESFFYSELKRLKQVISQLGKGKRIFVLLDEILKGTNSKDQQTGSIALIEQLIAKNGAGLIATHDLKLGEMAKKYPEHIINQCFEIKIENDRQIFDYKLKDGLNQSLNATFLMKQMGIIPKEPVAQAQ